MTHRTEPTAHETLLGRLIDLNFDFEEQDPEEFVDFLLKKGLWVVNGRAVMCGIALPLILFEAQELTIFMEDAKNFARFGECEHDFFDVGSWARTTAHEALVCAAAVRGARIAA